MTGYRSQDVAGVMKPVRDRRNWTSLYKERCFELCAVPNALLLADRTRERRGDFRSAHHRNDYRRNGENGKTAQIA
jgi:hypothetical protein